MNIRQKYDAWKKRNNKGTTRKHVERKISILELQLKETEYLIINQIGIESENVRELNQIKKYLEKNYIELKKY